MLNAYLGNLNKFNPYSIENIGNKNYIHTFKKMEDLSLQDSQSKMDRTIMAVEQLESIVKNSPSVERAYEAYWNSQLRTLVSFSDYSKMIDYSFEKENYQMTVEWVGELVSSRDNTIFRPLLLKIDEPLRIQKDKLPNFEKSDEKFAKGLLRFSKNDTTQVNLIDIKEY